MEIVKWWGELDLHWGNILRALKSKSRQICGGSDT